MGELVNRRVVDWVQQRLRQVPEVSEWAEMGALVDRLDRARSMSCLEYPLMVARALGQDEELALPAVASIFCSLTSINLVDDILDRDPRGDHVRWGEGVAANLALAFQALAVGILEDTASEQPWRQSAAMSSVASMMAGTALGQNLDLGECSTDEQYWMLVDAKTSPLFTCALKMGALLAGGTVEDAQRIGGLGFYLGRIVQVNDDVGDSLEVPAKPDWRLGSANLPILYASIADHAEKEHFVSLLGQVEDPGVLAEAQRILVESGAISFAFYQVVTTYREARRHLEKVAVPHPDHLQDLLDSHLQPLRSLLTSLNIEMPVEMTNDRR